MGDVRSRGPLRRVEDADDPAAEIRRLGDEELVHALLVASRERQRKLADAIAARLVDRLHRTQAILDHLGEGVVGVGPDGRISFANPAAQTVLDRPRDQMLGQPLHDVLHVTHDGRHIGEPPCPFEQAVTRGAVTSSRDRFLRAGDRVLPVDYTVAPIRREGSPEGAVLVFRDASDRVRAEEALRENEERCRRLAEGAFDAIMIHERGIVREANGMVRDMFGYAPEEAVGRHVFDFVAPESREKAAEVMALALEEPYEAVLVRKDGSTFIAEIMAKTIPYDGRTARVVDVRDVTRRKQAEDALRASERRFRRLVEATSQVVWITAPDGTVLWTQGWQRLTGQAPEELEREGWLVHVHPDDRDRVSDAWRRSLATGEDHQEEFRIRTSSGEYRHFRVYATPLRDEDGAICEWFGTLSDITSQKRSEEELRRAQERYRQLVELAPEPMAVHAGGTLLYANPATARLLGASDPAELVGRNVLEFVHPESRELVIDRMRAVARKLEPQPIAVEKIVRLDGRVLDVEVVAMPTQYDGRPAVQLALRDVTETRLLDEERRSFREELETRVRDRTAALQAVNRELESFTYSVSHDLRAPLRGVTTFAQLLAEDHVDELSPEGQDLLERLRSDATRMQQIVEDLLTLSRTARGDLRRQRFDLADLAREVAGTLQRNEPPERPVEWTIPPTMPVDADPRLVRVVLENLLGNALKFTRGRDPARIEVGEHTFDGKREFFVRDNGAGFDMAQAGRLFQPFQRLHAAAAFEGTGIGLATVARIVERHGGRVRAEGEPGAGATIAFTLEP